MLKEFGPNSPALWQQALAVVIKHGPHDNWEIRAKAVVWYYDKGGRFINTRPPAQLSDVTKSPVIKNMLASKGIELTASLISRSLDYQWREYLGSTNLIITPPNDGGLDFRIKRGGFFGVKAVTGGYSIMLPDAHNTQVRVPHLTGYTLISLSRELSLRERKFRD